MNRTLKTVSLLACGLVLVSFVVVVVNQTAQVVDLAGHIHPIAGTATLVGLVGLYTVLGGVPAVMFLRLPRAMTPPESEKDPRYEEHLELLADRLTRNPAVSARSVVAERDEIDLAIAELDTKADAIVRETAAIIFLSTAISQFGKLDGLIVLGAQSRMVWKLAHLYSQRPAPGDLVRLYSQVATTAFVAGALEEIDLNEVVQPVVSTAFGSMAGSIPGLGTATTLLSTSVLTGTANAFLTLRVGLIARRYCGAVVQQPAAGMRRAATVEAAGMLGGIVREGSSKLVKSFGGAAWNLGSQAAGAVGGRVKGTFTGVADRAQDLSGYFRRPRGAEPTA